MATMKSWSQFPLYLSLSRTEKGEKNKTWETLEEKEVAAATKIQSVTLNLKRTRWVDFSIKSRCSCCCHVLSKDHNCYGSSRGEVHNMEVVIKVATLSHHDLWRGICQLWSARIKYPCSNIILKVQPLLVVNQRHCSMAAVCVNTLAFSPNWS